MAMNGMNLEEVDARCSSCARSDRAAAMKERHTEGISLCGDFADIMPAYDEISAVREARRCTLCVDPPCTKGCPAQVDARSMVESCASNNYYGAAKVAYTKNPFALSCGSLCSANETCQGCCTLGVTAAGPVQIARLQKFACNVFRQMQIKQKLMPSIEPRNTKVAIVGAGPSGLSCAAFLARLGYQVTVFEKLAYAGGTLMREIPEFRVPKAHIDFDISLIKDLGVDIKFNMALGKDFTVDSLKADGFEAVYLGIGKETEVRAPFLDKAASGAWTGREFLSAVNQAMRFGAGVSALPQRSGHVVVVGAGDAAIDAASSAFRCGAERVSVLYRKTFGHMRCLQDNLEAAIREKVEFLPLLQPTGVVVGAAGQVEGVSCVRMQRKPKPAVPSADLADEYEQTGDTATIKCDFLIYSFGAKLDAKAAGDLSVDPKTQATTSQPWVFAGGDAVGSYMVGEAVNDGTVAAKSIHVYLTGASRASTVKLPAFYSDVDDVDLGVEMNGIKFENPFGLASATPGTSIDMVMRAFKMGWGFLITKTFAHDKDLPINIGPRIARAQDFVDPSETSFLNIELITEKPMAYWLDGIRKLKKKYPKKPVIASVMCQLIKQDWVDIIKASVDAGADAIEMNLSCPNGVHEAGMGSAIGQDIAAIERVTRWATETTSLPVFPKLTPNITHPHEAAAAAFRGGAAGVTAINTVSGLITVYADAKTWLRVGKEGRVCYGGLSGDQVRPIALKQISDIANSHKDKSLSIMGVGGIKSGWTALQFIYAGATVLQVCSAIQRADYSIIRDMMTGLQWFLFARSRADLRQWTSQHPPKVQKFAAVPTKRRKIDYDHVRGVRSSHSLPAPVQDQPVPTVNSLVGAALPKIGDFGALNNREQVRAVVDAEECIGCGRCVLVCRDTGYSAITINKQTRVVTVNTNRCMGCGLCMTTCPVQCIGRELKDHHFIDRGRTKEKLY